MIRCDVLRRQRDLKNGWREVRCCHTQMRFTTGHLTEDLAIRRNYINFALRKESSKDTEGKKLVAATHAVLQASHIHIYIYYNMIT